MDIITLAHTTTCDDDIKGIAGSDCKISNYSHLSEYNDLEDLLPKLLGCDATPDGEER